MNVRRRSLAGIVEAARIGVEIDPMNGEQVESAVNRMLGAPAEIVGKAQAAMGG